MKPDNLRKRERLLKKILKEAEERKKKGFYEGEALAYLEAAKLYPEDKYPAHVATCFNNAGLAFYYAKKYIQAEDYLRRALIISQKKLGNEHPDTARTLYNLGKFYNDRDEFDKAVECYQKSLIIREKIFGKEHPDVVITLNNLGNVFYSKGEFYKAEEYHQIALNIEEKIFGRRHNNTAITLNNLGAVYDSNKELNKADKCFSLLKVMQKPIIFLLK
jgi:tetratricopeptide (TPR) repeat protein